MEDRDEAFLHFYPNGTADQAKLQITRYDDEGLVENVYVVRINGLTGHIKVKEKRDDDESYF